MCTNVQLNEPVYDFELLLVDSKKPLALQNYSKLSTTVLSVSFTDLISAPVPGGLYGESKHQARPGQVSCYCIPENVKGVCPRLVATCTDVTRQCGDGVHVTLLEAFKAPDLIES